MFALFQSFKRAPSAIQMKACDLKIMPSVYKLDMTIDVISTSKKCLYLISSSNQRQNYIE